MIARTIEDDEAELKVFRAWVKEATPVVEAVQALQVAKDESK